jgi:hypothetical protein
MIQKVTTVRLRSTSNPQTHVPFLGHKHMYLRYVLFQILKSMSILKFTNRRPILKSMAVSHFLKSTPNDVTDICPNPNQQIGHRSENLDLRIPLNRTVIWDDDVSGCWFDEWTPIWVRMLIWVYHIYIGHCLTTNISTTLYESKLEKKNYDPSENWQ